MEKMGIEQSNFRGETEYYADTMEQEREVKPFADMNREKGIYVHDFSKGLNVDKGVFDSSVIFKTKNV